MQQNYDREKYISIDPPIRKELLRLFNKKDKLVILDIGDCEGEESIRYSRLFPLSKLYIFEPLPKNIQLIENNLKRYQIKNVELVPKAVSDIVGVTVFYVSSGQPGTIEVDWDFGNKSSSLLPPKEQNLPDWLKFEERIKVETITLESFILQNKIDIVDFAHIDVQGAELRVLKGANKHLKNIKSIWLEVTDIEIYKNQPLRSDVEEFMKDQGFYLTRTFMNGFEGDQLYINEKYFMTYSLFSKSIRLISRVIHKTKKCFTYNSKGGDIK